MLPGSGDEWDLDVAFAKVKLSAEEYEGCGSGWVFVKVHRIEVHTGAYRPFGGSSYIPLPPKLAAKEALINIKNNDERCFMWAVLAALHPVPNNPHRLSHYQQYAEELNFSGMEFPLRLNRIPYFERLNSISINVFGYDEESDEVYPLVAAEEEKPRHANLLLYTDGDKAHYVLIRSMSRLLANTSQHEHRRFFCNYCLHGFTESAGLQKHRPLCSVHDPQRTSLPQPGKNMLEFTEWTKTARVPYVIYADFECLVVKTSTVAPNSTVSSSTITALHEPCGFSYVVVGPCGKVVGKPIVYRGDNVVEEFLQRLMVTEEELMAKLRENIPMKPLTPVQWRTFHTAPHCHICSKPFHAGDTRVRDHDHLTGEFRGPAHNACNLNYRQVKRIPVFFHNLRGYDSHPIIKGFGQMAGRRNWLIPTNMEKFVAFGSGNIVFVDSLQFLNASLDTLVGNLEEGDFHITRADVNNDTLLPLLTRKGVYPYEFFDHPDRFLETTLPPQEQFYSTLTGKDISDDDYRHAQAVWEAFGMETLGDYHDLYLKTDVLLLADVFEGFRRVCMDAYTLDPAHYLTGPSLAWAACLKMTGVQLELLTDPDQHLFVESAIRGGISVIANRYGRANNPLVPDYDSSRPNKYLIYWDMNNLYGTAMCLPLPVGGFAWVTSKDLPLEEEGVGYFLEVDLEYPEHLHDTHADYPLAPQRLKITADMLSPYSMELAEELKLKPGVVEKLVPTLYNKERYVLHHATLRHYEKLGLKVTKVHRILSFRESPWMKSYIVFNTEKRQAAKNDFEKSFFKLMNNAVFGKTMENLRFRVNAEIVTDPGRAKKLVAQPSFKCFMELEPDLAIVQRRKPCLVLNRPLYVGASILDLSKTLMYQFHYEYVVQKYEHRAKLLFTDTDSLCYEIETLDLYADIRSDLEKFDTSDHPRTSTLYSTANKKVLGKFKDELSEEPMVEFIGLRAKMYSILGLNTVKKTAKGVPKHITAGQITHDDYQEALFERRRSKVNFNHIASNCHQLQSRRSTKVGLSPYDDKRYILQGGFDALPHGHWRIASQDFPDEC